jgi:hypothetical protein
MNCNNFYNRIQIWRLTDRDTQNQGLDQNIFKNFKDRILLEHLILHFQILTLEKDDKLYFI